MFETYESIKAIKQPGLYLVRDHETGTLAVRKVIDRELVPIYEKIAQLSHEGLPRIYATEVLEDSALVFYEYIEGQNLESRLKERGCTHDEALDWMCQLCSILSLLHSKDPAIIHRDIKPSNILIGDDGTVRLIDFGAARNYREGVECDTYQIGTRGYAAPEQYGFKQSDARTDIYAAGVILSELMSRCNEEKRYARIIAKCTHIYPEKRFNSATALSRALKHAKGGVKTPLFVAGALFLAAGIAALALHFISIQLTDKPGMIEPPAENTAASNAVASHTPQPTLISEPITSPTPIPEPDPVMTQAELSAYTGSFENEKVFTVTEEEIFFDVMEQAKNDPEHRYCINLKCAVNGTEDITILPSVTINVVEGASITMAEGTQFTNYGSVYVLPESSIIMGDDTVLNCGEQCNNAEGELFFPFLCFHGDSRLEFGENVFITQELCRKDRGNGPRLEIAPGCELKFADPSTVTVRDEAYLFIYFDFDTVEQYEAIDFSPFISASGQEKYKPNFYVETAEELEQVMAVDAADPKRKNIVVFCSLTIPSGRTFEVDCRSMLLFNNELTVEDGAAIVFAKNNILGIGENAQVRIKSGGTLIYDMSYMEPYPGARLVIEEGATVEAAEMLRNYAEYVVYE